MVLDFLFEGEVVGAAFEGVGFVYGDAVFLPAERDDEAVLAIGKGVSGSGGAEGVVVAWRFAAVCCGQAALQEESAGVVAVQQGERFAAVFAFGVGGQGSMDDGAAFVGDVQFEDVGFDVDDGAVGSGVGLGVAGDVAAGTAGCGRDVAAGRALRDVRGGGDAGGGRCRGGRQVGDLPFLPEDEGEEGGRDV